MVEDLKRELQTANKEGDQLVVGGDFNLDMRSVVLAEFANELTLENVVFQQHGMEGPNTHTRRTKQIDGFLVSRALTMTASGYLSFNLAVTDHRTVWFNTTYQSIYGHLLPRILSRESRRLQIYDPRVVNR